MGGEFSTHRRVACRVLVGKPKGKRPLGRHRRTWEGYIKKDLPVVGWDHRLKWLRIGQVAGSCECGYEPSGSRKRGEFLD